MNIFQVADLVSGTVMGSGEGMISGVADVQEAEDGDLVFAESLRYVELALKSPAKALLVGRSLQGMVQEDSRSVTKSLIFVDNPRAAFVKVLEALAPVVNITIGIDASARVGSNVTIGQNVSIAPHVTIEDGVVLGEHVRIMAGVHVGRGSKIGDDTVVYPNVVIYPDTIIGARCILHAGCVLGADGFGYVPVGITLKKVPHLGNLEIGDDVEVGANTCIDRAKTGSTIIGSGTKIDNLVHIGHNVRIGMSCLIIAQTGVAGSVKIGHGVVLAGQSGIKDHVTIGDGARVAAQGGVFGDVAAGVTVSGYPARPHREKMREYGAVAKLPEYIRRIRDLERRLSEFERTKEK